jgi:hypothetical protein
MHITSIICIEDLQELGYNYANLTIPVFGRNMLFNINEQLQNSGKCAEK